MISAIAARAGEEMADDRIDEGDKDSELDIVFTLFTLAWWLGVRRGRLADEKLWRKAASWSLSGVTGRRSAGGRSVCICNTGNGMFLGR